MTLERSIAAKAKALIELRCVGPAPEDAEVEYRALAESLPAMLRACGPLQTLTFLDAKPGTRKEMFADIYAQFESLGMVQPNGLMAKLTSDSIAEYRLYSQIAMRIAFWHKRLAQAVLRKKERPSS